MAFITLRQLLDHAAEHDYGVPAFNVNNMEQIQSIMEAARETRSPVIVQASRGARAYSQDRFLYHLMLAATEGYGFIPGLFGAKAGTPGSPSRGAQGAKSLSFAAE